MLSPKRPCRGRSMKAKDLFELGFKPGKAFGVALRLLPAAQKVYPNEQSLKRELKAVLDDPVRNATHEQFSELADALREDMERPAYVERPDPAPFQIWGENLEATAVDQIKA